jgi:hypothetical protein
MPASEAITVPKARHKKPRRPLGPQEYFAFVRTALYLLGDALIVKSFVEGEIDMTSVLSWITLFVAAVTTLLFSKYDWPTIVKWYQSGDE